MAADRSRQNGWTGQTTAKWRWRSISDEATRNALTVTRVLDIRSGLLQTVDVVKAASLDPYSFVRDGFLQKRRNDIYDGNPPSNFDYGDGESDPK